MRAEWVGGLMVGLLQELSDVQEKYKQQSREYRDAMSERKKALDECTDMSEK